MGDGDEVAGVDDPASDETPDEGTPTRYGAYIGTTGGDGITVLHATTDTLFEVIAALRDAGYGMLLDLTAVDYLTHAPDRVVPAEVDLQRFELVVHLISHAERARIRVKVQVDAETPVVPSLFDLFPGSENMEREVFDLFGISFDGHPDMTRVLMPEDWEGHPLRKDYAVGRIPVQFKAGADS